MDILAVQNLHKAFGGIKAVNHCSFTVEKGSITGLIGPNGAGKTTVFDLITGLMTADEGHILLGDLNISAIPIYKRARLGLARTFQAIRIFPELTVVDNLVVAMKEHPEKLYQAFGRWGDVKKKLVSRAIELLEQVGIADKWRLKAGELSYGQQKLLEIARAVATGADLFLLDEPAAGINLTLLKNIRDYIVKLNKEGKTFLIVEHNMPFIMDISNKIIVLDYGKEIAVGTPKEIQDNPHVIEAYLGKK